MAISGIYERTSETLRKAPGTDPRQTCRPQSTPLRVMGDTLSEALQRLFRLRP